MLQFVFVKLDNIRIECINLIHLKVVLKVLTYVIILKIIKLFFFNTLYIKNVFPFFIFFKSELTSLHFDLACYLD